MQWLIWLLTINASLLATEKQDTYLAFKAQQKRNEQVSARSTNSPSNVYYTPLIDGPFKGYCAIELRHFSKELMAYALLDYVGADLKPPDHVLNTFDHLTDIQQHQLLEMHQYYELHNFIACISQLPQYKTYVTNLYTWQQESTKLGQWWNILSGKVPRNIAQLYQQLHPSSQLSRCYTAPHTASSMSGKAPYDPDEVRLTIESSDHDQKEIATHVRSQALQEAETSQYAKTKQTIELSIASRDFLQDAGLDALFFSQCVGDAYQQQLHQEFVSAIDQAALLRSEHRTSSLIDEITQSVGECAFLGCNYSDAGNVVEATHAADLCHTLVEFGYAIAEGIYDGVCAAGRDGIATIQAWGAIGKEVVCHPSQAFRDLGTYAMTKTHAIAYGMDRGVAIVNRLTDHLVDFLYDAGDLVVSCFTDPALGKEVMYGAAKEIGDDLETAAARICQCCAAFAQAVPQHCTSENARIGAALVTEYGLNGAATIISNKLYTRVAYCALSYAAGTATKAGKALFDVASQTTQRMAQFAADTGTALGKSKYISVTSQFFATKKNDFTALVTWSRGLMKPCNQLAGLLESKTITVTEEFLKHLFTAELKTYKKRSGHIIKKLSGFHHFKKDKLEEMGIQLLNSKVCKKTGVILADVLCDGHVEPAKTFFPLQWSQRTIIKKIKEALASTVRIEAGGDRVRVYGKTSEGIIIFMVIDKMGKLITAFPDAVENGLL